MCWVASNPPNILSKLYYSVKDLHRAMDEEEIVYVYNSALFKQLCNKCSKIRLIKKNTSICASGKSDVQRHI